MWRLARMEGAAQRTLGAINAAELTRNFLGAQIECVIVDVVTATSVQTYRAGNPRCLHRASANLGRRCPPSRHDSRDISDGG